MRMAVEQEHRPTVADRLFRRPDQPRFQYAQLDRSEARIVRDIATRSNQSNTFLSQTSITNGCPSRQRVVWFQSTSTSSHCTPDRTKDQDFAELQQRHREKREHRTRAQQCRPRSLLQTSQCLDDAPSTNRLLRLIRGRGGASCTSSRYIKTSRVPSQTSRGPSSRRVPSRPLR